MLVEKMDKSPILCDYPFMEILSATEVKQNFGAALDLAQREPVHIRKQNREVAVLLSPEEYLKLRGNADNAPTLNELRIKTSDLQKQVLILQQQIAVHQLNTTFLPKGASRAEITQKLTQHKNALQKMGIQSLYLFGSTAQDKATDSSDVDLFFDYNKGTFSLFNLMDVKKSVADILQRPVDIMTRDSIHRLMRPEIEASAIQVF
jgi:hypothetical protein